MKKRITCPNCKAVYDVDESQLSGFNVMTCDKCEKDFDLSGNVVDIEEEKKEEENDCSLEELNGKWQIAFVITLVLLFLSISSSVLGLALIGDGNGIGVIIIISSLLISFNLFLLLLAIKSIQRTLRMQESTNKFQKELLDAINKI